MVVAVLPFKTTGIDKRLISVVTNTIRGVITKNQHNMLRDDRMREILKEKGLKVEGCATPECGIKLGKILQVDSVIIGEILLRGDEVYMHSALIDVKKRVEIRASQTILKNSDNIRRFSEQAKKMAYQLLGKQEPGLGKGRWAVIGGVVAGGAGYATYQYTRPKEGDVELIVNFPMEK